MDERRYRTAAGLVFMKMGVNLLMFVFALLLQANKVRSVGPVAFRSVLVIGASALNIYILFTLRRLLWDRYDFHRLDAVIPVLAVADVVLEVFNQAGEIIQFLNPGELAAVLAARILIVIVPWGVLILVFAAGLLKLPFAEGSLLRPYAYLNLVAGIVLVSMVLVLASPVFSLFLFPILLLTGVGSDILLGLTFLRSRETEQVEFV
jgi:hypothetical protein